MGQTKLYEVEGERVEIPLCWDEGTQTYVEDYSSVIETPIYSPSGRPVLLTIEDACPDAHMVNHDPISIDCGSCRYYHQFPGSLLGVCRNEKRRFRREVRETENKKERT